MANMQRVGLIQGNEACAVAAIDAGIRFFAGYPITPSTEIAEMLSAELPKVGGKFIQMEDELGSMAAIVGASFAGLKSMTATSGPGISLMMENLGFAAMVEAPCLVVNVQRGGPSTGLPTKVSQGDIYQARYGSHGDYPIIAIAPYSVKEVYYKTIRAVNLAEKYRTPVILLMDEVIGHMREKVKLPNEGEVEVVNRVKPNVPKGFYKPYEPINGYVPPMASFGDGHRFLTTGLYHDKRGYPTSDSKEIEYLVERLHKKIYANIDDISDFEEFMLDDAEVVVVSYGSAARAAKEAVLKLRQQGIKVGLFRLITIWPFPDKKLKQILSKVKKVVVIELNYGQIFHEVERLTDYSHKLYLKNRYDGELLHPDDIASFLKGVSK